jgi:hypothetical protein
MALLYLTILVKILRVLGTLTIYLIGLTMICLALFLKVNEEGVIQNRLEQLAKAVDNRRGRAQSKAARFVQVAATITAKGFDELFGHQLMSLVSG